MGQEGPQEQTGLLRRESRLIKSHLGLSLNVLRSLGKTAMVEKIWVVT